MIIFTNKAYNAIIRESFDKDPVETGGILLGHVLDNGMWIVMEVLPPGINSIFEYAYFEYDDAFVNYLAQSVANQYKIPLELLGLWHRHPGSMDYFSSTDDQTNATFAAQNSYGVISGLVNIDPKFRLTMYHLGRNSYSTESNRPRYERIQIEVGDDIIPEDYFELRYYDGNENNLHPTVNKATRTARTTNVRSSRSTTEAESAISNSKINIQPETKFEEAVLSIIRFFRRNRFLLILILIILFALSLKTSWKHIKQFPSTFIEWVKDMGNKKTNNKEKSIIDIRIGDVVPLNDYRPSISEPNELKWIRSNDVVTIRRDTVVGVKVGKSTISVSCGDSTIIDVLDVSVKPRKLSINKSIISLQTSDCDTLLISPHIDNIMWFSSDTNVVNVATVDSKGIVTARSTGECTIKCVLNDVEVAKCTINVSSQASPEKDKSDEELSKELIRASLIPKNTHEI